MTGDAATTVLVHSPLTSAAAWGDLPSVLRARGHRVAVVDVPDDDAAPFAARFVARAALQLREQEGMRPVRLVGHSGAGYLLPLLGAARRAARAPVAGYVFLDAVLPSARPASRLDLMRAEAPGEQAEELASMLATGGRFPDWTDTDLRDLVPDPTARAVLLRSLRPRGEDFFTDPVPVVADWPDAPCGLLRLSPAYDGALRRARLRGWPVVEGPDDRPGGHFASLVDPGTVADDLAQLVAHL